jgi:hypothetical protein
MTTTPTPLHEKILILEQVFEKEKVNETRQKIKTPIFVGCVGGYRFGWDGVCVCVCVCVWGGLNDFPSTNQTTAGKKERFKRKRSTGDSNLNPASFFSGIL